MICFCEKKVCSYLPSVSFIYPPRLLLVINCDVRVVFPESEPPKIKTVYLVVAIDVFFIESLQSSSVLDRKLDLPDCVRLKLEIFN